MAIGPRSARVSVGSFGTGRGGELFKLALSEGVLYVPGEYCYGPDPTRRVPRNTIRLSFGVPTPDDIRTGIARLAHAIRSAAAPRTAAGKAD